MCCNFSSLGFGVWFCRTRRPSSPVHLWKALLGLILFVAAVAMMFAAATARSSTSNLILSRHVADAQSLRGRTLQGGLRHQPPRGLVFAITFMAVLWIPPLWEHVVQDRERKMERDSGRKSGVMASIARAAHRTPPRRGERPSTTPLYAVALRQTVQGWLTHDAQQGNRKVHIGYNDMLFYRPDLRALTGFGPLDAGAVQRHEGSRPGQSAPRKGRGLQIRRTAQGSRSFTAHRPRAAEADDLSGTGHRGHKP